MKKGKTHKQNCTHFSLKNHSTKGGETVHPNSLSKTSTPNGSQTRPAGFSELKP